MLRRNLIANYVGQGWTALMGLAFIPLYIKYLGIEAYGLIGLFAVLQAWLGLLDMGMTQTLGREMARFTGGGHGAQSIRDLLRSIELVAATVALLITGGVAISAHWIANSWLKAETLPTAVVAQAFAVMGLVASLRFIEGVYRAAIVGLQRQVLLNAVNSAMATLRGFGAVGVLIWVSPTIEAFFVWQGIVSIATLAIFAAATYATLPSSDCPGRFSVGALRGVGQFAGGIFLINLLNLSTQVDKVILSSLLPLNEYGTYMLAVNLSFIIFIFIAPIQQAYYPRYCELHARDDLRLLIEEYHKSAQLVTVFAGSAAVVLASNSEVILKLWIGDGEVSPDVTKLVILLVIGYLLIGLHVLPKEIMFAHAWTGLTVKLYTTAAPVVIGSCLVIVPRYGAEGAAYIMIAYAISLLITMIHLLHRHILVDEKWRWYIQDVLLPLAAAILGVSLLKILWPNPTGILQQSIAIIMALLVSISASALAASHVRRYVASVASRYGRSIFNSSFKN